MKEFLNFRVRANGGDTTNDYLVIVRTSGRRLSVRRL